MFPKEGRTATHQMDKFLGPGYAHHFDTSEHLARDEYQSVFSKFYIAFPDLDYEPVDIITEGDRAAVRFMARGTHCGDFFGVKPTKKVVSYTTTYIYCVEDHLIQEDWENWDGKGFDRQMGLPL